MKYRCTHCLAERYKEERKPLPNGDIELKVIYECGSYSELRRIGHTWKQIAHIVKCGDSTKIKRKWEL